MVPSESSSAGHDDPIRLSPRAYESLLAVARRFLGCHHLAEDVLQEALIELSRQVEVPTQVHGWLVKAIVHRSRHLRRSLRRRRHHEHAASAGCELHGDCDNPLHVAVAHELGERLAELRELLSREQQQAIDLFVQQGKDYKEISALLGVPVGTVRSRLSRARSAIKLGLKPWQNN